MIYPDLYGAFDIAREYCGFSIFPKPLPTTQQIMWQHGFVSDNIIIPEQIFGAELASPSTRKLVANKKLKNFYFAKKRYEAHAVGLPVVYIPKYTIQKKIKLLVYPGHGVPGSKTNEFINIQYSKYIKSVAHNFSEVQVIVFGPDYDKRAAVKGIFEEAGFEVVRGVDDSKYALHEQKKRFLNASHVTTNVMGSHIPYAASLGCNVSISGPYQNYEKQHLEQVEFYRIFPEAIQNDIESYSNTYLKSINPWLFCEPHEAKSCEAWGNEQIGFDCKLSPMEMCKLFEWTIPNVLKSNIKLSEKMRFLIRHARN